MLLLLVATALLVLLSPQADAECCDFNIREENGKIYHMCNDGFLVG